MSIGRLEWLKRELLTGEHFVLSLHLDVEFKADLELPVLHQSFELLATIEPVFGGLLAGKILA